MPLVFWKNSGDRSFVLRTRQAPNDSSTIARPWLYLSSPPGLAQVVTVLSTPTRFHIQSFWLCGLSRTTLCSSFCNTFKSETYWPYATYVSALPPDQCTHIEIVVDMHLSQTGHPAEACLVEGYCAGHRSRYHPDLLQATQRVDEPRNRSPCSSPVAHATLREIWYISFSHSIHSSS